MLVFTGQGNRKDENDENAQSSDALTQMVMGAFRPKGWQMLDTSLGVLSLPKFLPQAFGLEAGHLCQLRERQHSRTEKSLGGTHFANIMVSQNQGLREGCGCPKFLAGKVFRQMLTLLENSSPTFGQHRMLFLPNFGHFWASKMAAGKSALPSWISSSETATALREQGFCREVPPFQQ